MRFPLILTPDDNGHLTVSCQSLPELATSGETLEAALENARAAIIAAIGQRIAHGVPVALPIHRGGGPTVELSALIGAKVALHNALLDNDLRRLDLAKRIGARTAHLDRLLDLDHRSRLDELEEAFEALGQVLEVRAVARTA
ncbi:hypothetical protein GCM10011390_51010 [Aureimonas endophytica]|uniref:Antitoxin HicB n=1 Tax=Aureimonas endophytica TaxID=2027858 RepID=A0A917A3Q8_9HYPH|nr:type II toxin-antitoxin system HicB family antitoxin [Aureimonas endophytica]GGE25359.1 hypothetical protein GCM10011390_51010 [Aureimonas endophytica]